MAIIVVGKRQPKSERRICSGCGETLEFQQSDLRINCGFFYLDCPIKRCKTANYLGTDRNKK